MRSLIALGLGAATFAVGYLAALGCSRLAADEEVSKFLYGAVTGVGACLVLTLLLFSFRGLPLSTKVATLALGISTLVFAAPMAGILLDTESLFVAQLVIFFCLSIAMWSRLLVKRAPGHNKAAG